VFPKKAEQRWFANTPFAKQAALCRCLSEVSNLPFAHLVQSPRRDLDAPVALDIVSPCSRYVSFFLQIRLTVLS
jgi:hypothetical protein